MMNWLFFLLGMMLGGSVGIFLMALLVASRSGEEAVSAEPPPKMDPQHSPHSR